MAIIFLGRECNNKCCFCSVDALERDSYYRTKEFRDKAIGKIDSISETSKEFIQFTGGEPTLNPFLTKLIERAREKGFKQIDINSNGRKLSNKAFAERLIKTGANSFTITVTGNTETTHDYLSGVKGAFSETIQGIKNISLLSSDFNVSIAAVYVLTKQNLCEFEDLNHRLSELDVKRITAVFVKPFGRALDNFDKLFPHYLEVSNYMENKKFSCKTTLSMPACVLSEKLLKNTGIFLEEQDKYYRLKENTVHDGPATQRAFSTKSEKCKECILYRECPGVWTEYVKRRGFNEFNPLKSDFFNHLRTGSQA